MGLGGVGLVNAPPERPTEHKGAGEGRREEASFALYLVHGTVMRALRYDFGAGPGVLSAFALSLARAFLLHEAVGKPMRAPVLAWGASQHFARLNVRTGTQECRHLEVSPSRPISSMHKAVRKAGSWGAPK